MLTRHRNEGGEAIGTVWPAAGLGADGAPAPPQDGAERLLGEALDRALRQPAGKLAVVLHLSRLPAPRAYHVRVARVLMQDCAQRCEGQVFALRSRDLVMIGSAREGGAACAYAPANLPASLDRLFAVDLPQGVQLTSLHRLDQDAATLRALAAARSPAPAAPLWPAREETLGLVALQEIIAKAPLAGLLIQQTGLAFGPRGGQGSAGLAGRLAPAFQTLGFSLDRLCLPALLQRALADPFLARHFSAAADARLLALLQADFAAQGPLLRVAAARRLPALITLGLRSIVSSAFAGLAQAASAAGLALWVSVALPEAGAAPELFEHARGLLRLLGCGLMMTEIDPAALALIRPALLQADGLVLAWSPALQRHAARLAGLAGPGSPARLILTGVDGEQALGWGQAHGFGLFAGPFLDQVQAALRMQRCHSARACSLAQCGARARSLAAPGRAGCANPALLAGGPDGP